MLAKAKSEPKGTQTDVLTNYKYNIKEAEKSYITCVCKVFWTISILNMLENDDVTARWRHRLDVMETLARWRDCRSRHRTGMEQARNKRVNMSNRNSKVVNCKLVWSRCDIIQNTSVNRSGWRTLKTKIQVKIGGVYQ